MIGSRSLSPVELCDSCLERIEAANPALNAFVAVDADRVREDARRAEAMVMRGAPLGSLHGLPVGIKDLDATAGLVTTHGSLIFKDHVPAVDDPHVARIRAAGGIVLGKTNTPEFGTGSNTTNAVYGATGNPFDPDLTCGGSSGGSAAALAAGMMPLATGSDYGGSLRTPAAFCGVVGFRPSPGVVPNTTRAAALSPVCVLGPMARNVADAHLLLTAEMGPHAGDPFSHTPATADIPRSLQPADLASVRAAISADLGVAPIDRQIRGVFQHKISTFRHAFRSVATASPDLGRVAEAFDILRGLYCVEEHGERLAKHRDLLGQNVIDNTERGMKHALAEVAWATTEQTRICRSFQAFFDEFDVLICPAAAISPFPHAQLFVDQINNETLANYMSWYTITWALSLALPAVVVVPAGRDHAGLPFGLQVVGPQGSDARILAVALALEHVLAANAETRRPVLSTDRLRKLPAKVGAEPDTEPRSKTRRGQNEKVRARET